MKHIVMFSGGAASSVVAKMVADKHPSDTILLYTPTGAEHPDADRFRAQVAGFIGLPITVEAAKKTLWEMVESYKDLPNNYFSYCTDSLKIKPKERFMKRLEKAGEPFITYIGFGLDEWRRIQRVMVRSETVGRIAKFPLFDAQLTSNDCKRIITDKWGICLPEPYKYLKHNNCIPCYKGNKNEWYKFWKYYPEQFWRAAAAEERAVNTVFYGVTLNELAAVWASDTQEELDFGDAGIPCMCAL